VVLAYNNDYLPIEYLRASILDASLTPVIKKAFSFVGENAKFTTIEVAGDTAIQCIKLLQLLRLISITSITSMVDFNYKLPPLEYDLLEELLLNTCEIEFGFACQNNKERHHTALRACLLNYYLTLSRT